MSRQWTNLRTFGTLSLISMREIAIVLFSAAVLANFIIFATGGKMTLVGKAEASETVLVSDTFSISNIEKHTSITNPDVISHISLTIASPDGKEPANVKVRLVENSSTWFSCAPAESETQWHCPVTGLSTTEMDSLKISITQ